MENAKVRPVCACCQARPAVFAIGATPVCESCSDNL